MYVPVDCERLHAEDELGHLHREDDEPLELVHAT
jgi:hypothetical protein